jgi:hypothetical protein
MEKKGRKLHVLKENYERKLIKRNYSVDERFTKALTVLSAMTGKDLSLLVNEAISDLISKYQPMTDIDLLRLKAIQEEG